MSKNKKEELIISTTASGPYFQSNNDNIPNWTVSGDWFDVCKCDIPCPCIFAQAPSYGDCDGILAYNIKKGSYGETPLDGLNVLGIASFKGNIWTSDGKTKLNMALFFDEKGNEKQREALNMIFSGKAGGFMADFAKLIGEVRGSDFAPIKFEVADDLSYWSAEIPGKALAKAEALTGPTTPPGKRVQTINPPGNEVGPGAAGAVATWGTSVADEVDAMGFKWARKGRSSKDIPFDWSGP
jgi:hypothetical protein